MDKGSMEWPIEIYEMEVREVFGRGQQRHQAKVRSLLWFWAARESGISQSNSARRLDMSPSGLGYAVQTGETIARENGYQLTG